MGLFFLRKPKKRPAPTVEPTPISDDGELASIPTTPDSRMPFEPTYDPSYQRYQPVTLAQYVEEPPDGLPGVPDLYAIVGVDPHASDEVIRYAYRRKAARLHERRWRPDQAVRQLAGLSAAYEILGKPDRRADYDRRRARQVAVEASTNGAQEMGSNGRGLPSGLRHQARRLRIGRPSGVVEVLVIAAVIGLAVYAAVAVLSTRSIIDLSWIVEAGESLGVPIRRRGAAPPTPATAPNATPQAVLGPEPGPVPPGVAVAEAAVIETSQAARSEDAVPTVVPEPAASPAPSQPQVGLGTRFAGSVARVSDPAPARRSMVTVTARVLRDGRPAPSAQVYAIIHYKTVDERWPSGADTQATDGSGETSIAFNIGDATPGYPVGVDVIARLADDQVQLQTSFTPR